MSPANLTLYKNAEMMCMTPVVYDECPDIPGKGLDGLIYSRTLKEFQDRGEISRYLNGA